MLIWIELLRLFLHLELFRHDVIAMVLNVCIEDRPLELAHTTACLRGAVQVVFNDTRSLQLLYNFVVSLLDLFANSILLGEYVANQWRDLLVVSVVLVVE